MDPLVVITTLASLAKDNPKAAALLLLWIGLSLLANLALAKRTQIDAWAESRPRFAGVLKIVRGAGLDPWLIVQGLSLIFRGKLPQNLQPKRTTLRPPPGPGAGGAAVGLVAFAIGGVVRHVPLYVLAALMLIACGPDSGARDNTPEGATVVILGPVNDGEGGVEQGIVCGGVALSEREFVTTDHCCIRPVEPLTRECVVGDPLAYADSATFRNTTDGYATARLVSAERGLARYRTEERLPGFVGVATGSDGAADFVHVVGSSITSERTTLRGNRFDAPVHHGDSGFGFFQGSERRLVGWVDTCDAPADVNNGTVCLRSGGTFWPTAAL